MDAHYWWIYFSLVCSLLPTYLLVRTVMHVLNLKLTQNYRVRR